MLDVVFDEPARHVAEQQALVLYQGDVCLGAATIVARGPSAYAELQHAQADLARKRPSTVGATAPLMDLSI